MKTGVFEQSILARMALEKAAPVITGIVLACRVEQSLCRGSFCSKNLTGSQEEILGRKLKIRVFARMMMVRGEHLSPVFVGQRTVVQPKVKLMLLCVEHEFQTLKLASRNRQTTCILIVIENLKGRVSHKKAASFKFLPGIQGPAKLKQVYKVNLAVIEAFKEAFHKG
jgi:hypothetical protein